jgi:predicted DNA-binding transcriptional regulator YafY
MERTERFYKIIQLLHSKRVVSRQEFLDDMEVSPATFKRDLEYLRDRLHAPIVWDRDRMGYCFDMLSPDAHPFELPGMWFNSSEVYALLVMEYLLENLQPGLLTPHIQPLKTQVRALLDSSEHPIEEILHRIKVLPLAARRFDLKPFEIICVGLLSRKRLEINQYSRHRDEITTRQISPQRLVYYRDNWYLDAWCHLRKGLRTFSVDTIQQVSLLQTNAKKIADKKLDSELSAGYGIFSGENTQLAKLRFTPERARWVAGEKWHSDQKSEFDADGYYILQVPYTQDKELMMDILKYGPEVEVLAPKALRKSVTEQLNKTILNYA